MSLLSISICLIQMTLVMLIAGTIARLLRRLAPESAAMVGMLGLLSSLAMMLLAVMNVPRPLETRFAGPAAAVNSRSVAIDASHDRSMPPAITGSASMALQNADSADSAGEAGADWGIPVGEIVGWLHSHQLSESPGTSRLIAQPELIIATALLLAMLPLVAGWMGTIQLHCRSESITAVQSKALRVDANLAATPTLEFRTSQYAAAPCVTLYGGRTIYLPTNWPAWTEAELSAAIAHEAAHLRRRDPLTRLIAQAASSFQLFHPLAIWLRRGVMLSQEMAADRDAAKIQGDRYAGSLLRMALRMDADARGNVVEIKQWFMRPGVVSVSSSHLIRRIEMLTKHPNGCGSRKVLIGNLSIAGLIALWAVCASWTVRADQPDGGAAKQKTSPAAERIASLPAEETEIATPFSQRPLSPWQELRANHTGYIAVRAAKLRQAPLVGGYLSAAVDPHLHTAWKLISTQEARRSRKRLGLTADNVEQVVGSLTFHVSKSETQVDAEHTSRMTIGSPGAKLWFKEPVAHDPIRNSLDVARIAKFLQDNGTSSEDIGGKTHVEFVEKILSGIFADGASTDHLLIKPPEKECDEDQFARIQRGWKLVDGGAITACCSLPGELGFIENREDELTDALLKHAACMAVGLDFDGLDPAHVRIAFVPRDGVELGDLKTTLETLIKAAKEAIDELQTSEDPNELRFVASASKLYRSHQIELASSTEGAAADCVTIRLQVPLDSFAIFSMF